MLVLSIDCAGNGCGVCVWQDGNVLANVHETMERGQDQRLMPLVMQVLQQAKTSFYKLDRIAVTCGPGSFTGLRIGLAAARGIGLATGKPVIGIDRFAIFHEQFRQSGKDMLVVINSRRKELYCRLYSASGQSDLPTMMSAEEITEFLKDKNDVLVTGDIASDLFLGFDATSEAECLTAARLAATVDPGDPAFAPRPMYIRAPDVTMPKSQWSLQALTTTHADSLTALHAESFGAVQWSLQQIEGSLALPTTQGWGIFEGANLIGFILCQIIPEQSEILTLCVKKSHRRRGAGEQLVQAAAHASQNGKLFLEVAADNNEAVALYKKLGFRQTGKRAGYYRHGATPVDALLFTLMSPQG